MPAQWRRQLGKFNDSTVGQLFWVALFVYSIYTGAFFTILFSALRIFFLVSWLPKTQLSNAVVVTRLQSKNCAAASELCDGVDSQISWLLPILLVFSMRQFNSQVRTRCPACLRPDLAFTCTCCIFMPALTETCEQLAAQMAAAQAQQRAAAAQQTTRRNPFGGSPFGGSPFTQKGRSGPSAGKPGPDFTQGGPIIDAEFETIDNGDH